MLQAGVVYSDQRWPDFFQVQAPEVMCCSCSCHAQSATYTIWSLARIHVSPTCMLPVHVPSTRHVLTRGQLLGCGRGLAVPGEIWEVRVLDDASRLSLEAGWAWGVLRTPGQGGPGTSTGHSALPCWQQRLNTQALLVDLPSKYLVKIIFKRRSASHSLIWLSPFAKGKCFFAFCFWTEHCSVDTSLSLSLASQSGVSFSREFLQRSSPTVTYTMVSFKRQSWSFRVTCCSNNSEWRVPLQLWFFCRGLMKVDSLGMGGLIGQEKS